MRLRILIIVLLSLLPAAFAQCEAVLQTGVFDAFHVLDDASTYALVKQVARPEVAGFIPIPGLDSVLAVLELEGAFDRTYEEVRASSQTWSHILEASVLINSNWLGCVRVNPDGLSHFVTPLNADTFMYRVSYTPNSNFEGTEVAGLGVSGASCNGTVASGTFVNQTGISLLCQRTALSTTAALTLQTVQDGANIAPILLAPFRGGSETRQVTTEASATTAGQRVCLRYSQIGADGVQDSGWQCSSGSESEAIFLGDDTGYRDQSLSIYVESPDTEVCFRHIKQGVNGTEDSDWVCSTNAVPSPYVVIGDDSGYQDQQLSLKVEGPGSVCLRHTRAGQSYRSCWSEGVFAEPIPLGSDQGDGEQFLWIELQP